MRRAQVVLLLAVLVGYLLPWGVVVTKWHQPEFGDPSASERNYVSGIRMTIDLARVAYAQLRQGGHIGQAVCKFALFLTHLIPMVFVVAVLVTPASIRPRLLLRGALIALPMLALDVLMGPTHLFEYAFKGAEGVNFPRYQYWQQSWLSGSIVALLCLALAVGSQLRRTRRRIDGQECAEG